MVFHMEASTTPMVPCRVVHCCACPWEVLCCTARHSFYVARSQLPRLPASTRRRGANSDHSRYARPLARPLAHHSKVLKIGKTTMVVSVPQELSSDHSAVLQLAEASGRVTEAEILTKLKWDGARPQRVLNELMQVRYISSSYAAWGRLSFTLRVLVW